MIDKIFEYCNVYLNIIPFETNTLTSEILFKDQSVSQSFVLFLNYFVHRGGRRLHNAAHTLTISSANGSKDIGNSCFNT